MSLDYRLVSRLNCSKRLERIWLRRQYQADGTIGEVVDAVGGVWWQQQTLVRMVEHKHPLAFPIGKSYVERSTKGNDEFLLSFVGFVFYGSA